MQTKLVLSFLVVVSFLAVTGHPPCGLYGAPPCQFVPAPPGQTPSCARPGRTYCEHVDHYPRHLIKLLVQKWGYESKNLIIDETDESFDSTKLHHQDPGAPFYYPQSIFGPNIPNHLGQFEGYSYDPPKPHSSGYSDGPFSQPIFIPKPRGSDFLIYSGLTPPQYNQKSAQNGYNYRPKVSQYNPADWLKRFSRDLSSKARQTPAEDLGNTTLALAIDETTASINSSSEGTTNAKDDGVGRIKRQSPGRETLCDVNTRFITPQAALNSRGNWMYVVNEGDTARQLVKTETCASSVCSNICTLPNGYTSRCEQKYVQKRLVALNSNGQNLYTDTFWFPSCCVCTLSNS